ncbi:MAG TPA: hypothetical protein VLW84_02870 [Terriglobales bacterium]|nr:hypothetical protein [Terriglobales bacterium]
MNSPAAAIRSEVHQLIQLQIQTFKQPASITSAELDEYHLRSKKIRTLYAELDRIGTQNVVGLQLQQAS